MCYCYKRKVFSNLTYNRVDKKTGFVKLCHRFNNYALASDYMPRGWGRGGGFGGVQANPPLEIIVLNIFQK